jgi:hypothetical protein
LLPGPEDLTWHRNFPAYSELAYLILTHFWRSPPDKNTGIPPVLCSDKVSTLPPAPDLEPGRLVQPDACPPACISSAVENLFQVFWTGLLCGHRSLGACTTPRNAKRFTKA